MSAALLTFAAVIRSRFAYTCLIYFWTGVWSFLCVDPGLPESGAPIFTQLSALCDCCAAEIAFVRAPRPCFRRCYDYSPLPAKHVYFWANTSLRRSHRRQMVVI
jgi:hypothetical protein